MAGIRLEFAQFGDFDSFEIIRSATSMVGVADVDLPTPIATGLTTMYYVDTMIVDGAAYYYKVRVNRDGTSVVSEQIAALAGILWTPQSITTAMYFSADSVVKDGSNRISQLTDLSGNNRHATQSTDSYKPVLSTFNDGSLAMQFDGVDDYFWQSNTSYLNGVSGTWCFSVDLSSAKSGYTYIFQSPYASTAGSKVAFGYASGGLYAGGRRLVSNSWAEVKETASSAEQTNITFSQLDYISTKAYIFRDGVKVAENSSFLTSGSADSSSLSGTSIGAYVNNNNPASLEGALNGKVGCIVVGVGILSEYDRQKLEGWAAYKYGLTSKLASDHPYKIYAPIL